MCASPLPLVSYNFRERHRHSFSVFVGNLPQRVRIRRPAVRQYITETRWHALQQIDDLPDGSFVFQLRSVSPAKWAGGYCNGVPMPRCWSQRACVRRWPRRRGH